MNIASLLSLSELKHLPGLASTLRRGLSLMACALVALVLVHAPAQASEEGAALDPFPTWKLTDTPALQNGAKLFVNYCLNCHSAVSMRYNRLTDLELTPDQIQKNLVLGGGKVGDLMTVAMRPADSKAWLGATPPDLSVIARARASGAGSGADWIYTYLRSYYRDSTRPTGWNNLVYPNVGMPNVLWELQGNRGVSIETVVPGHDGHGGKKTLVSFDATGARSEKSEPVEGHVAHEETIATLQPTVGGKLSQGDFDDAVADLVAYITYMSDPTAGIRHRVGVWVMLFLALFMLIAWNLNRVFWKRVR